MGSDVLDMPDDYPWLPGSDRSPLADLGELAARLGSIVTYDRRGSVLWFDDFEHGLSPWLPQTSGTGAQVLVVADPTYRGGYAAKCIGGSDSQKVAGVLKRVQPFTLGKLGWEVTLSLGSPNNFVRFHMQHNDGSEIVRWTIELKAETNKLKYRDSNAVYQIFTDHIIPDSDEELFHTIKLVVDVQNREYVRFMIDQSEYSLAGIKPEVLADTSDPRLEFYVFVASRDGQNDYIIVDSAIITVGES